MTQQFFTFITGIFEMSCTFIVLLLINCIKSIKLCCIVVVVDCGIPLPPNHRICWTCAAKRKCTWCHRYLREVRFDENSDVCKACRKRKHHLQEGGGSIKNIFIDHYLDGEALPVDQLILEKLHEIEAILTVELEQRRYVCKVVLYIYICIILIETTTT